MTPMPASSSSIVTPVNAPVIMSSKVSPVLLSVNKTITRAVHRQPWKSLLLVLSLLLCFLLMTDKTVNNDTLSLSSSILVDINDISNDTKLQWVSSLLWMGDVKFVNPVSKHQWLLVPDQVDEDTFMIKHSNNYKCLSQTLQLKPCQNHKNRWYFKDNLMIASNGYSLSGKGDKIIMSNKEKDKKILMNVVLNEKKFTNIVIRM
jgi:NhaP-type Na+/H+ and K+/H+ antiporter